MIDRITRKPDGSGFRYFNHGRPWICSSRCLLCGEFGKYADTGVCESCERFVAEKADDIRAARRGEERMSDDGA